MKLDEKVTKQEADDLYSISVPIFPPAFINGAWFVLGVCVGWIALYLLMRP